MTDLELEMIGIVEGVLRDVLRDVRKALHTPEGASVIRQAEHMFRMNVWACNVYDILDSLLESDCGFDFMEDILRREMDKIPK
jgi:hypothetical protein